MYRIYRQILISNKSDFQILVKALHDKALHDKVMTCAYFV